MREFRETFGSSKKRLFSVAAFVAIAASITFIPAHAAHIRAQAPSQSAAPAAFSSNYKYDVVSVKPTGPRPDTGTDGYGSNKSPDGLRITGATLRALIMFAYVPIT